MHTVQFSVKNVKGQGIAQPVRFALQQPYEVVALDVVLNPIVDVTPDATGAGSISLHPGDYKVTFPNRASATISVPNTEGASELTALLTGGAVYISGLPVLTSQIASQAEAEAGLANDKWMSPLRVAQAIVALSGGGSFVELANLASQAEAEAGSNNTQWMTPLRVAQAIAALAAAASHTHAQSDITNLVADLAAKAAAADLSAHLADLANPHSVTASQVGLGNLVNALQVLASDLASQAEAEAGSNNAKWMTPLRVAQAIAAFAAPLSHVSDTDNPHAVTASQVGLGSVANALQVLASDLASQAEAEAGSNNTKWMTPLRVAQAIAALGGGGGGKVVQRKATKYSTWYSATGNLIPLDDTLPQNTEGGQVTTYSITPTSAANRIRAIFAGPWYVGASSITAIAALFKDSDAPALSAFSERPAAGGSFCVCADILAGGTAAITFKLRAGVTNASHPLAINGDLSGRWFGGAAGVDILLEEYVPES